MVTRSASAGLILPAGAGAGRRRSERSAVIAVTRKLLSPGRWSRRVTVLAPSWRRSRVVLRRGACERSQASIASRKTLPQLVRETFPSRAAARAQRRPSSRRLRATTRFSQFIAAAISAVEYPSKKSRSMSLRRRCNSSLVARFFSGISLIGILLIKAVVTKPTPRQAWPRSRSGPSRGSLRHRSGPAQVSVLCGVVYISICKDQLA